MVRSTYGVGTTLVPSKGTRSLVFVMGYFMNQSPATALRRFFNSTHRKIEAAMKHIDWSPPLTTTRYQALIANVDHLVAKMGGSSARKNWASLKQACRAAKAARRPIVMMNTIHRIKAFKHKLIEHGLATFK